jgi:hypothetical protein
LAGMSVGIYPYAQMAYTFEDAFSSFVGTEGMLAFYFIYFPPTITSIIYSALFYMSSYLRGRYMASKKTPEE